MFSLPDACHSLNIPQYLANPSKRIAGISIDTRTLKPGDFFIALSGRVSDGNQYLEEAFRKGASGALLNETGFERNKESFLSRPELFHNLLPVTHPERTLTALADWHRRKFKIPVIGITGSVGKTTTKEFLYFLLKQKGPGLANQGNLNNHIGVPMTLLRLEALHEFCVCELGANHQGEIRELSKLLQPTDAILTLVSPAHLEGFGSLENIYAAKLEILESLPPQATLVLPDDDEYLIKTACKSKRNVRLVGFSAKADYRLSQVECRENRVQFCVNARYCFNFPGSASFFVMNAAMALALVDSLGYPLQEIPSTWDGLVCIRGGSSGKPCRTVSV